MKRLVITALLAFAWSAAALAQYSTDYVGSLYLTNANVNNILVNKLAVNAARRNHDTAQVIANHAQSPVSLKFNADGESEKAARVAYLSRLKTQNPGVAKVLEQQMRTHDFTKVYSGIIIPFGLHRDDIGDAMTAYTMLGWMIATGSGDPTREQVQALRTNIAQGLAAEPKFADPATRAALGEEIVISFVTLHAGWQSARREGKLQQYSDGVAAMFQKQTGNDLRQLVLTDRGLEKRG